MNAITFDTHRFVKRLTAAGMPEAQAEILAEEQAKLIDERLVTKADLAAAETSLKRDIKEVEIALKRDIEELSLRMTIRLGGMMAVSIAVVAALVKLL